MKKKIFVLFIMLFGSLFIASNVEALSISQVGDTVTQEGDYESTRFVAGNDVTNKANVDGLSFIAGNEVNLEGSAPYGFYAGNLVKVNEQIEKDLFVAGNEVTIDSKASIGRDLYVAGNKVVINTNIARDLRAAGTSVDLSNITIGGDAYIEAEEIILDSNTVITGTLSYPEDANIKGLNDATIGSMEAKASDEVVIETSMKDIIYDFVISIIAAFIVMVVILLLVPKAKEKLEGAKLEVGEVAKITLIGLALLIVVPVVSIIALFTGILTPLAFITLAIYAISIYLSSLLVSYIIGNLIAEKVIKKDNMYLALICGIVVVKVIKLIPALGGLVSAIALFYGLGLIYKFIKAKGE